MITYRLREVLHGCSASARRNVKGEVLSPVHVSGACGKRILLISSLISTMVTREEWLIRNPGSSQQPDGYKYDQVVPVASVGNDTYHLSSEERSRRVPQLEEAKQSLSSESQRIRCLSNSGPWFSPFVYNEDTRVS